MNAQLQPIIVESGVPMPKRKWRTPPNARYPWASMEVGDSFLVPRPSGVDHNRFSSKVSNAANEARKRTGRVFRCRSMTTGVRVWRVA